MEYGFLNRERLCFCLKPNERAVKGIVGEFDKYPPEFKRS
jgi:hypothetical protein